jgi:hypothetical protein
MSAPIFYRDSLASRAAPQRFRQIGNPYAFLNGVGIEAMLDEIRKGHNLVEIAEVLDVSIGVLLRWIDVEGHTTHIDEAFKFSAEGHLAKAAKAISQAENDFQLKKAKEMANHGRFMASKMDRNKYGAEAQKTATGNIVQFVLHMGQGAPPKVIEAFEGTADRVGHSEIVNDGHMFRMLPTVAPTDMLFVTPEGVAPPDNLGPFEEEPFMPDTSTVPEYLTD